MSQENVETIARLYDEVLSRGREGISLENAEFFDPEIEVRQSRSLVGTAGTFRGYDGLRQSIRETFEAFSDCRFARKRLMDIGDQVVAITEVVAQGKESGVDVRETIAHVWTLRAGRIVIWEVYWDPAEALEAAGLSE